MTAAEDLAAGLAGALLAGVWNEAGLLRRGRAALDLRIGLSRRDLALLTASVQQRRRQAQLQERLIRLRAVSRAYSAENRRLRELLAAAPADNSLQERLDRLTATFEQQRRVEQIRHQQEETRPLEVVPFAARDIAGWLRPVVRDTLAAYHRPPRDRPRELAAWLAAQPDVADYAPLLRVTRRPTAPTAMAERQRWEVRPLADVGALAGWLRLDAGELAAFADTQLRNRRAPAGVRHYRVTARTSRSGSVRVLEAPKERLKTLQRLILSDILGAIPVHDAAHGFTAGRSALTAAQRHVGRPLVVLTDLESFFASVSAPRIYGIFRAAGYSESVAHVLTGLCTTALSTADWDAVPAGRDAGAHWRLGRRLAVPHLPQGAPTSPALANAAAWSLDLRLRGLARSWHIDYTRYADDLVFSGPAFRGSQPALMKTVGDIVTEEGFALNAAKTRSRTRSQRQGVMGIVVNDHPAVPRGVVDELRAILHNCARSGPGVQNRESHPDFRAHLQGRVSWVAQVHPVRGRQLQEAFDRVDWDA